MSYVWKHRPTEPYLYGVNSELVHVRLTTRQGDFEKANIIYGDPYDWKEKEWQTSMTSMKKEGSDGQYDYWMGVVKPPYQRMRYGFQCLNSEDTVYLTERGELTDVSLDSADYFCLPFLHKADLFHAPEWVTETVWYQIFPDRFAKGNPKIDPQGTLPWDSEEATPTNLFGGDLQGVIDHLDHLVALGINGIYFTPIFEAKSNHKYDTIDYMKIDPQFGDGPTLKKLVQAAHERGIKIMLDAVFNHSGYFFPPFQDVLEKGEESSYLNWFHIESLPVVTKPQPNYKTFAFTKDMPKLNTANPDVQNYLLDVAAHWIEEYDIDGWRLDVANEVDHRFWRAFRDRVKGIKPDVYILGEVWHDSLPWLRGDQFDAVMNYRLTGAALDFIAKEKTTAEIFQKDMVKLIASYPHPIHASAFNLLGSHDTARVLTQCGEDSRKALLLYAFQMTMPGSPCVYYGDEIGMSGENDPGCRDCMKWDPKDWRLPIYETLKKLIRLRHKERLLRDGGQLQFYETQDEDLISYGRLGEMEAIFIVMNRGNEDKNWLNDKVQDGDSLTDLMTGVSWNAGEEIDIPPAGFRILKNI